jgi:hypothetical protein
MGEGCTAERIKFLYPENPVNPGSDYSGSSSIPAFSFIC